MPKSSSVKQIISPDEKEAVCRIMLSIAPEWRNYTEYIDDFAVKCRSMPFWADMEEDAEIPRGFMALRETSPFAAEIFAMSVRSDVQPLKAGKGIFTAVLNFARRQGYEYIQAKTIKQGTDPVYDTINILYQGLGFRELELLPLWKSCPCQLYICNVNF